jgi:hypothetical protein
VTLEETEERVEILELAGAATRFLIFEKERQQTAHRESAPRIFGFEKRGPLLA